MKSSAKETRLFRSPVQLSAQQIKMFFFLLPANNNYERRLRKIEFVLCNNGHWSPSIERTMSMQFLCVLHRGGFILCLRFGFDSLRLIFFSLVVVIVGMFHFIHDEQEQWPQTQSARCSICDNGEAAKWACLRSSDGLSQENTQLTGA